MNTKKGNENLNLKIEKNKNKGKHISYENSTLRDKLLAGYANSHKQQVKEQRLQTNVIELYIFPKSCGEW